MFTDSVNPSLEPGIEVTLGMHADACTAYEVTYFGLHNWEASRAVSDPSENRALSYFEKFCFGTDNPEPSVWVPASENIMDALEIPDDLRRRFYWDNAAAILGIRD